MKLLKHSNVQPQPLVLSKLNERKESSSTKSNIRSLKAIMNQGRVPLSQYIKHKPVKTSSITQHLTYFDKMKVIFNKEDHTTHRQLKPDPNNENHMDIEPPPPSDYKLELLHNYMRQYQNNPHPTQNKNNLQSYDVPQKGRSNSALGKNTPSQQSYYKLSNLTKHRKRTTELDDVTITNTQKTIYTQPETNNKNNKMPNLFTHLPKGRPVKQENINYNKFTSLYDNGDSPLGVIELNETLGCGANATVRVGRDKKTGVCFAIKIYEKYKLVQSSKRKRVFREMQILSKMNHPNIIRITHSFEDKRQIHILFEYINNAETLQDYLRRHLFDLPEPVKQSIALKIIQAICFLHGAGVSHRDIKTENIIVNDEGVVKLIDFGFATTVARGQTHCGTPNYMAPELFEKKNQYDPLKVDIWAFGILFYYLFEGTYPFKGYNEKDLIKNISLGNIHFKKMNPPLQALIRSLLTVNPLNRPTASDILHQLTQ